jgi:hypothetical protein
MTFPAPPYPPFPPRPPGSIKVLGIINLVFAGLGVFGLLFTYSMYFGGMKMGPRNPVIEVAHDSPEFMTFMKWSIVHGLISIALLATAGIGLIKVRSWGRSLAIFYALQNIVAAIVGLYITHKYLMTPLKALHDPAADAGVTTGYMGGVIAMAYPIVLLAFMIKRNVREHFARVNEPPVPPARVV